MTWTPLDAGMSVCMSNKLLCKQSSANSLRAIQKKKKKKKKNKKKKKKKRGSKKQEESSMADNGQPPQGWAVSAYTKATVCSRFLFEY